MYKRVGGVVVYTPYVAENSTATKGSVNETKDEEKPKKKSKKQWQNKSTKIKAFAYPCR